MDCLAGIVMVLDMSLHEFDGEVINNDQIEPMEGVEVTILVLIGLMVFVDVFGICLYIYGSKTHIYTNRFDESSVSSADTSRENSPILKKRKTEDKRYGTMPPQSLKATKPKRKLSELLSSLFKKSKQSSSPKPPRKKKSSQQNTQEIGKCLLESPDDINPFEPNPYKFSYDQFEEYSKEKG